jgi:hypothetical protein
MLTTQVAQTAASTCRGADPAITNVSTSQIGGDMTTYALKVTVANVGSSDQRKNVLQSVKIILDGQKKDQKGVPPLAAGQSYTFTYDVHRASDAGPGTTRVGLRLVMDGSTDATQNCSTANDFRRVVF